ncbi:aKG-HExxH-type peptide beta-hydroxylase [Stella humosa]|uniref:aKG-HExxH-type peptide beta-hydroxylase n=1 Tax=Stella humosa TaxID=94 RepID=UPI00114FF984|nr:HEXXH motif-containing putative peptide modification protein [Stella humosa]
MVRADFAASLGGLLEAFARQDAIGPAETADVMAAIARPSAPPGMVAAYAGLVEAIYGDQHDRVMACLEALVDAARRPPEPEIQFATLEDAKLGPGQAARYRALFDDDPAAPLGIVPAEPTGVDAGSALARSALALLDRAAPELSGEIRALLRQIVFVRSVDGDPADRFQGASVFLVWGAVLLNLEEQPDRLTMAESLAHETGHSLLSGFTRGRPLVENDPADRYRSPLRSDPRPMDGIVHATYVTARMHYCLERLLASDALDAVERSQATTRLATHRQAFGQGLAVVDAHARFTPVGQAAFAPARDYMAGRPG